MRAGLEDDGAGALDAALELLFVAAQHELEELRHAGRVLLDLLLRARVEDCQPGVDVPLVAVDAQRDVDLDVLDAADVPRRLPGELVVRLPGRAHAQEGGMRDGLSVRRDDVVLLRAQIDHLGAEAGEDLLDGSDGVGRGGPVVDDHERLALWFDFGSV